MEYAKALFYAFFIKTSLVLDGDIQYNKRRNYL